MEVVLLEQARLPDRAFDERLRGSLSVLLQDAGLERPRVHPDADGYARGLCRRRDLADLVVELADVPGIHTYGADPSVDGCEDIPWLEVDVGDHRDLALARNDVQYIRVVLVRHGHAHDVAPGRRELGDLLQGRVDVRGLSGSHRLHAHLSVTADLHLANGDLASLATRG